MNGLCTRGRRSLVTMLAALSLSATAMAQKLDLDAGGSFKAGSEKSVERLEKDLNGQVKDAAARLEKADAGAALLIKSQNRVREFAAALLEAGASMGDSGSVHVLLGRRIAARAKDLDTELAGIQKGGGPEAAQALGTFLQECPADGKSLPRSARELDALTARIFARLDRLEGAHPGGQWPIVRLDAARGSDDALRRAIEACAKVKGVTPEAVAALKSVADGLSAAEKAGEPASYVVAHRQLIVQGADVMLLMPKWLPPKVEGELATGFDSAARRLGAPETHDTAAKEFCRFALLADVLKRIDEAKLTSRQIRSMRGTAESVAQAVGSGEADCDDSVAALRRGLVLLDRYEAARWNENHRVVREVRPLWHELEVRGRGARDEVIDVLERIKPKMPALSDPGVLGGMGAVSEVLDDGKRLCVLSAWLAGEARPGEAGAQAWGGEFPKGPDGKAHEPATEREDKVRRQAALKLLQLGQKAHETDSRDEAIGEMRALADGIGAWMPVAGEDELRAAGNAPDSPVGARWQAVTGGATADIVHALDAAREQYLMAWAGVKEKPAKGTPAAPAPESATDVDRIGALRRLVEIAADCALVMEMADPNGKCAARAWPGFELSPEAFAAALGPVRSEVSHAGGLVASANWAELDQSVKGVEKQGDLMAMLAKLERAARSRTLAPAAMLGELADPPPVLVTLGEDLTPGVWLAGEREGIAVLCRSLEEYAEAIKLGETSRATPLLTRAIAEAQHASPSIK